MKPYWGLMADTDEELGVPGAGVEPEHRVAEEAYALLYALEAFSSNLTNARTDAQVDNKTRILCVIDTTHQHHRPDQLGQISLLKAHVVTGRVDKRLVSFSRGKGSHAHGGQRSYGSSSGSQKSSASAQEQLKFLMFMWNGTLYEFQALPMGLTSSTRIFPKVMKPPLAILRKMGFTILGYLFGYIDDFFLQERDIEECKNNVRETVKLFLSLGFTVHPENSVLIPSHKLTFRRFILNSQAMTVTPSQDQKIRSLCLEGLRYAPLTIRFAVRVIGKIISFLPGAHYGKLHYRNLERDKINALASHNGDFDAFMHISPLAKEELNWLVDNSMQVYNPLGHQTPSQVFQTDSIDAGWGVVCTYCPNMCSSGIWSEE
ncbi:hypothetical protein AC249_AIPGENE17287 [Exaiptasia diaphana]|nr:hypothetical protein AC249_AIPGENE17287 [Exaiptasia diaphana]